MLVQPFFRITVYSGFRISLIRYSSSGSSSSIKSSIASFFFLQKSNQLWIWIFLVPLVKQRRNQRLFALAKYFQCYLIIKKFHSHYSSSQIFGDKRPFCFWIRPHSASPLKTCFLAILPRYSPFFCCVLYIPICAY